MGIIVRQSLKQSVVTFVGIAVAFVAQIFIYTLDESKTYGQAQQIFAFVALGYPIMLFGIPQALIKFFNDQTSQNGYLSNFLLLTVGLFVFFIAIFSIFGKSILDLADRLDMNRTLLEDYGIQIVILIFMLMLYKVLAAHMSTHRRIVWPGIFDGLWTKFALAMLVLLILQGYVSLKNLSWGMVLYYGIALVALIIYAAYLGKLNLRYNPSIFKDGGFQSITKFSAYTGLAVFGGTLATRIDTVMVAGFTNGQLTGVYVLFLFLAGLVDTPTRAISQISGPIIAQANERGDIAEVKTIYAKSAQTLFLMGLSIFALINLSIHDLFDLSGKGAFYDEYIILFVILGLIRMIPATFASVGQIILYSKYYRFTLFVSLVLGVMNILLNFYFIRYVFLENPLTGICLATAIAISIQYTLMVSFVRIKFGIHPFHYKMLVSICIVALCFCIGYYCPTTSVSFVNIILRSVAFIIPFIWLIYTFKVSEDVNSLIDQAILRIKNRDFKNLI